MDPRLDPVDDDLVAFRAPPFTDGDYRLDDEPGSVYEPDPEPAYRFVAPGDLPWPTGHDDNPASTGFWEEADTDRRSVRRHGPRRRPPWARLDDGAETPRWRHPVVIAVAVVAVVCVGFGLGRLTAGSGSDDSPYGPSAGPATRDGDAPAGFAHSREGAMAAATDFTALVATPALADTDAMSETLDAIAAPGADFGPAAGAAVDALRARLTESGMALDDRVTYRTFPLTARVRRFADSAAEVEVWAASVLAVDGARPVGAAFVTYRMSLTWTGSDWRLDDLSVRATPADSSAPPELTDFDTLQYEPAADG